MSDDENSSDDGYPGVIVDIGILPNGGEYNDCFKHKIEVKRDENSIKGYKKYTHMLSDGFDYLDGLYYCLDGIYHHQTLQNGFPLDKGIYYDPEVIVYYLVYDLYNLIPLIVGITRDGITYGYYKKDSYTGVSDQWQSVGIIQYSEIQGKLDGLNESLKEFVVLNLGQTIEKGIYFVNGDLTNAPDANKTTKVTVSSSDYETIYKKYTHNPPQGSKLRPISTKHSNEHIPFENSLIYTFQCDSVSVYYWKKDGTHKKPLLLELTTGPSSTYYTIVEEEVKKDGTKKAKWKKDSSANNNLENALDKENCKYNDAHTLNISKNVPGLYQCPTKCGANIAVSHEAQSGQGYSYSKSTYSVSNSSHISVSRFKEGSNDQIGLPTLSNAQNITIFFYPKDGGNPLLIYCDDSENCWYKRNSPTEHTWSAVNGGADRLGSVSEHSKIHKLLLSIYAPEITIKAEHSSGTYSDNSMNVTVEGPLKVEKTKCYKFTHERSDKRPFIVKEIHHINTAPFGISPAEVLTEVALYCYKNNPIDVQNIFLVELIKKSGTNRYVYYKRQDNVWSIAHECETELSAETLERGPNTVENTQSTTTTTYPTNTKRPVYTIEREPNTVKNTRSITTATYSMNKESHAQSSSGEVIKKDEHVWDSSSTGLLAALVILGMCFVGIIIYECLMIHRNPKRSIIFMLKSWANKRT